MNDLIDRQAAIDMLKMDTTIIPYKKARQYVDLTIEEISERLKKLPSAQPEPCDDPRADVYYLAEKIGIHRLYALVVELRGEPEPCEDAVSRAAAIKCCTFGRTSLGLIDELRRLPSVTPKEQRWIPCVDGNEPKANADCWISTNAKYVRRASYAPKANNKPNGFIVTEGGFEFYEYGKSAKAWMPYDLPEPYREEGEK